MEAKVSFRVVEKWGSLTLQGPPRETGRNKGIPPGGVFDTASYQVALALLGLEWGAPVLEFAGDRLALESSIATTVAAVGATDPQTQLLSLKPVEVMQITRVSPGMRIVIAAHGLQGKLGEEATVEQTYEASQFDTSLSVRIKLDWIGQRVVRFIPETQTSPFTATLSHLMSRAGLRAESSLPGKPGLELSEPSIPGLIQITPDGTVIIIGPDGPTIGGYARLGVVISADRPVVAQLSPGDTIQFRPVTVEGATALHRSQSTQLTQICDNLRRGKV